MALEPSIGKAIRKVREHRKMSQEDFVGKSSQVNMSRVENDKRGVTIAQLQGIAEAMLVETTTVIALAEAGLDMDQAISILKKSITEIEQLKHSSLTT